MTMEERRDAAMTFHGTCSGNAEIAVALDVVEFSVEDAMLDFNLERCPDCEWWCESCELIDEAGDPCPCESCRG